MSRRRRYTQAEVAKIRAAAEECVLQAPDDEVLSELREEGEDPATVAQEVRAVLLGALAQHKKAGLRAAELRHSLEVGELGQRKAILPDAPAGRRRLLERVLASLAATNTGRPAMATVQYRMCSDLTDDEVSQQLNQMAQLGLLDSMQDEES